MASAPNSPGAHPTASAPGARFYPLAASIWQAPLVPVTLAVTAGIVADRYGSIPMAFSLILAGASLVAWLIARKSRRKGHPIVYLWMAAAALGAACHHGYREIYAANDIGQLATSEPRPVRVRGLIVEEPTVSWQVHDDPLQSMDRPESTVATLEVSALRQHDDWVQVSGRARLIVMGQMSEFHVRDEVEVVGRLMAPNGPANPGEFDYASYLRDQRMRAQVVVRKTPQGVTLLAQGWPRSLAGWLGVTRMWGQRVLAEALPPAQAGVAMALLLGDGSTMTNADWEKYIRTGVIHVLAISGQHLVVLAGFLWFVLRLAGIRRRRGALGVALFLLAYSLLTGGHPPVMRSAATVCLFCGGLLLRRITLPANSFALAWLTVAILKPTDLFTTGCQLSFLSVAILYWGVSRWFRAEPDPLGQLVEESRPRWMRWGRWLIRQVLVSYGITLVIWLALAPLVAARYNLISISGLFIGPPVVLLTSIALLSGFLLLTTAAVCAPLVPMFAWVTRWSLAGCEFLVNAGDAVRAGRLYVSGVSEWWLWVFYVGLLAFLTLQSLRTRWQWVMLAGPPGKENHRSMVLLVRHGRHAVLLTGDLEGPGLQRVLGLPLERVDVLMAPHHGSRAGGPVELANREALAARTRPRVVVSCQGLPRWSPRHKDPYGGEGVEFLATWPHGAITVRSGQTSLVVETFQTGKRIMVASQR
jgi:competence protein ComEC